MKQVIKNLPIKKSEVEILDALAELLADDFLARKAAGTIPKP